MNEEDCAGLRLAILAGSSVNSILKQLNSGESENRVSRRSNTETILHAHAQRCSYRTLRAKVGGDSYTVVKLGRCMGRHVL